MKRRICILSAGILAIVMSMGATLAAGSAEEAGNEMMTIAVGTTGYTIEIPADSKFTDIDEELRKDDMVSCYYSAGSDLDIDIYQFLTEGMSLEDYIAEESAQYGAEDVILTQLNDIPLAFYPSVEEKNENTYQTFNYLFAADQCFAEIVIWIHLDNKGMSQQEQLAMAIINSIRQNGVVVSSAQIRTDSPAGFDLVLDNQGEMQIWMDVSAFALEYDGKRYYPTEAGVLIEPGQGAKEYTFTVGVDLKPGAEFSLYYGNILL